MLEPLKTWFIGLSQRERVVVVVSGALAVVYLLSLPVEMISTHLEENAALLEQRRGELSRVSPLLARYAQLNTRLEALETTFRQSQMTFEQVTAELDTVVKDSIGSTDYTLNKIRNPSKLGLEYEKQEFSLHIRSLTLDQLLKLLYTIEQGRAGQDRRPLFLGKIDLSKPSPGSPISATLEIFSVRKSEA
jgi:hypothetical protein